MNADAFRHFYEYHFSENRKIWDEYVVLLSQQQFVEESGYSQGSIRDQIVHLMSVDDSWFGALRDVDVPASLDPAAYDDRDAIRAYWDGVEQRMRDYLAALRDDMLLARPWSEGEDKELILWQVLLHVANHGTDHRAQILRSLNDQGLRTGPQDYVFYLYDNP